MLTLNTNGGCVFQRLNQQFKVNLLQGVFLLSVVGITDHQIDC